MKTTEILDAIDADLGFADSEGMTRFEEEDETTGAIHWSAQVRNIQEGPMGSAVGELHFGGKVYQIQVSEV